MRTLIQKLSTGFGVLGLVLFGFQGAALAADADSCTAITAVPFTISKAGNYCLTVDIATPSTFTSGDAITINSDNVIIDLDGHNLGNLPAGTGTTAIGISALDHNNITIFNGTVRGFNRGIRLGIGGSSPP
jgi:hypothetical protein